jgi:hypothetical protein
LNLRRVGAAIAVLYAGCGGGTAKTPAHEHVGENGPNGAGADGGADTAGSSSMTPGEGGLESDAGKAAGARAGTDIGGRAGKGGRASEAGAPASDAGMAGGAGADTGAADCKFAVTSSLSSQIATVGIIEWSTDFPELESASIEFGLDLGYGMTAPVDLSQANFRTLLIGMKSNRNYHYRIVATGHAGRCVSNDFSLTTGALPNGLPKVTLDNGAGTPSGGFLLSGFLVSGPAFILDADGDYVWAYGSGEMGRVAFSRDGKYLWYTGINVAGENPSMKRVTLDGLEEQDFTAEFGQIHHDFTVLPDETIAFLQHDGDTDWVVEHAPDGTLHQVVNLSAAEGGTPMNHANSIHYAPDDDAYTVSDLSQNAILRITRDGKVLWTLGGATSDFTGDGASWSNQHGHQLLAPDELLFFSNGPHAAAATAIEVHLDFSKMTATRVWEYSPGQICEIYGDVNRLDNGNTLVTFSTAGVVHEVTPDGQLVQATSWALPGAVGYTTKLKSLYVAP